MEADHAVRGALRVREEHWRGALCRGGVPGSQRKMINIHLTKPAASKGTTDGAREEGRRM